MQYMQRWDDYRVRREHVIEGILRARRKQSCGMYMLVFAAFILRAKRIEDALEQAREKKQKELREAAIKQKLAQEAAAAQANLEEEEEEEGGGIEVVKLSEKGLKD